MREPFPLQWPDGWARTKSSDRQTEERVVIRWREQNDPPRLQALVEILANIMDTAGTPEKDGRP